MQFKNVIATIAALSVASVLASPMAVENGIAARSVHARTDNMDIAPAKRAEQKEDMINQSEQFAQANAGQIPTDYQVAQAAQAAQRYGPYWWGGQNRWDWSAGVAWNYPQYYYLSLYNTWPNQQNIWANTYNIKNCLLLC